jgi:hypothetical protein
VLVPVVPGAHNLALDLPMAKKPYLGLLTEQWRACSGVRDGGACAAGQLEGADEAGQGDGHA